MRCDAFGVQLGLATLPGSEHTACRDACATLIFDLMGIAATVVRMYFAISPIT